MTEVDRRRGALALGPLGGGVPGAAVGQVGAQEQRPPPPDRAKALRSKRQRKD